MVSVSVAPTLLSAMVTPATANGSTAASAVVVTAAVLTVMVGATAASLSVTVTVLVTGAGTGRAGVAQREGGGRAGAGRAGARREHQRIQVLGDGRRRTRQGVDAVRPAAEVAAGSTFPLHHWR